MELKPEILTHPNIPKPLHGLSPRTIMGQKWWDNIRIQVYRKYEYHCIACGISKFLAKGHKWLEAHEYWNIDYMKGICEIKSIEPLCHYCHNFIHSGRLSMIIGKEKTIDETIQILEHGFEIIHNNKLKCFPSTLELGYFLKCNTYDVDSYILPDDNILWSDWKLIWDGKEYYSKFASFEEWRKFYANK